MSFVFNAQTFALLNQGPGPHEPLIEEQLHQFLQEMESQKQYAHAPKLGDLTTYQQLKASSPAHKGRVALALAQWLRQIKETPKTDFDTQRVVQSLLQLLLRSQLLLTGAEQQQLFRLYGLDKEQYDFLDVSWPYPVLLTLDQVAKLAQKNGLPAEMQTYLPQLLRATEHAKEGYGGSGLAKLRSKIMAILDQAGGSSLPSLVFAQGDRFGQSLSQFASSLPPAAPATAAWLRLLQLWQKASGSQPTAKLHQELLAATAAVGPDVVGQQGLVWLALLATIPVLEERHTSAYAGGRTHTYTTYTYLLEANVAIAKGLVWTMQPLADAAALAQLTALVAKCFRKIPGKGPLAAGLGNACLLALAQNGLPGVAALARVRAKIRQTNTQELIARYIAQESAKLGVSPAEIEDMAAPDFGLSTGQLATEFDDYVATLTLADGKAEVQWQKAGKPLKSAPAALKATHADELKELKSAQAQAQQTYAAQRDRLDRSFVEERRIAWPWFAQYYFAHGLLSLLARLLIWRLHQPDGTFEDALWVSESWRNVRGQPVPAPTADTQLQLWHPVLASPPEVLAWRELLKRNQLRQPLKQAFREVYLLTPPEEHTRTYSNRMAAHILKQHQFNSLAKLRGWRYRLLGAYDKGYDSETASLPLPAHNLTAEYWVSEVYANGEWNDTGIYNYISTDQVRFVRGDEPVPLPEVPPLAFSEVMRDVDLFVGVASVGNDPQWRDNGGPAQFRNYWESYSFGDLSEVAKTRKLALQRLVPRLKIGKVSEIKGNFLVVKGHRHTYKIHLGSGNILMEPGDQYLCIVPDRSSKSLGAADVFLPFEGDAVLSIILSKAQLLMDDNQITDETILRQLAR